MRRLGVLLSLLLLAAPGAVLAQQLFDAPAGKLVSPGWAGFHDMHFLASAFGEMVLAAALGAVVGYHPMTARTVDRLHEADMPKVYIIYAFIGAVIGLTVREFGMVIGVVVFGIGGLIRFRTDAGTTRDTGRLIVVTLAGLIAGLGLPHLAVLTIAFAFIMILMFDATPACRLKIEQAPKDRFGDTADVYRAILQHHRCKIIAEHRSVAKDRIEFVLRMPRTVTRNRLQAAIAEVPVELRGDPDWEFE
jgi:uncharacterized membrane protein YhaH (DUF805 family)